MGNKAETAPAAVTTDSEKTAQTSDYKHLNVYQKVAAILGEITAIAKEGTNSEQHYKFIEHGQVSGALREKFGKYGLVIRMGVLERTEKEITTSGGKKALNIVVRYSIKVINADKPDDFFEETWDGEATDYSDKATSKASTTAMKYYLMRLFQISDRDDKDPDETTVDRGDARQSAAAATAPAIPEKMTKAQNDRIFAILSAKGITGDDAKTIIYKALTVKSVTEVTSAQAKALIDKLDKTEPEKLKGMLISRPTKEQLTKLYEIAKTKLGPTTTKETATKVIEGVYGGPIAQLQGADADALIKQMETMTDGELLSAGTDAPPEPTAEELETPLSDDVVVEDVEGEVNLDEIPF